jgi:fumarate reductase subunit D
MSLDTLPINLFDFAFFAFLIVGVMRGRKLGMSGELLSLFKWMAILAGCAFIYEPAGQMFAQSTGIFSMLASYLTAYVIVALVIFGLFTLIHRSLGGKLVGSDIFGSAEYYLGMGSGMVRFGCIALAGLALLNARYFNASEIRAEEKFQKDVYGSNFFPTLHSIQATVFERSFSGRWIKENLSFLLIKPTAPETKEIQRREVKLQ